MTILITILLILLVVSFNLPQYDFTSAATVRPIIIKPATIKPAETTKPTVNKKEHRDEIFNNMFQWITKAGAKISPDMQVVTYSEISEFRGIHTTRAFAANEVIISLPLKVILTPEVARASTVGRALDARMGPVYQFDDYTYMALFLAEQRRLGKASFWEPYIASLPVDFRNMPINFNNEEMQYLRGTWLEKEIKRDIEDTANEYAVICPKGVCEGISLSEYTWGLLVCWSRAFSLKISGHSTVGLMPYSDLFNHDFSDNSIWRFNDTTNEAEIVAYYAIPKSTPITISYGSKDNPTMLSTYGFTLADNPNSKFKLLLGLPDDPQDVLKSKRMNLTVSKDSKPLSHKIEPKDEGYDFFDILKLARISVATKEQLENSTNFNMPVTPNDESLALRYILDTATRRLRQYPTPIEDDNRELKRQDLTSNIRNIIVARRSEKQSLEDFISSTRGLVALAESDSLATFKALRGSSQLSKGYEKYLSSLEKSFKL